MELLHDAPRQADKYFIFVAKVKLRLLCLKDHGFFTSGIDGRRQMI